MDTIRMRKGDRLPPFITVLTSTDGTPLDLTGATVELHMRLITGTTLKVNAPMTISSATDGEVTYNWAAADTNSTGFYWAEFEATLSGLERTIPNPDFILVHIMEALG